MGSSGKPARILILSHTSYLLGGAEMSLLNTVDYWSEKYNIEPIFILRRPLDKLATALQNRGWKYYDLEYTFWSNAVPPTKPEDKFRSSLRNSKAIKEIERIISDENPDLVMTNSLVCPWAALASYFQQKPHIWFVREYGDLDHGREFEIGRRKTLSDIGSLSELVVANSQTLSNHLAQYIDTNKLTTMYTPFSLEEIGAKANVEVATPYIDKSSLKVVITGTLTPSKGQREAIEAVGLLSKEGANIELCIIGSNGPKEYLDELNQLVEKYNISKKVHFVGFQANPLAYLRQSDIGIMASRKEAFGRVTFEYLATGRPVVGANSGATPEMVIDGETGYLYMQGDASSLADALRNYIINPNLIQEHGDNAKAKAISMMDGEFNADSLYDRIADVITDYDTDRNKPINYFHRWLDYIDISEDVIKSSGSLSIRKLIKSRLRLKARTIYHKVMGIKAKVSKR